MKSNSRRYLSYAAVLVSGGMIGASLTDWRVSNILEGTYKYDIEVTVTDSDTGEKVPNLRIKSPSVSSSPLFQQSTGMTGGSDGIIGISGIAYESRTWTFGSDDYHDKELSINDQTQRSIDIRLEPKKSNESQMASPRKPSD